MSGQVKAKKVMKRRSRRARPGSRVSGRNRTTDVRVRLRGRGDYRTNLRKAAKMALQYGGGALGHALGYGFQPGYDAGDAVAKLIGVGPYGNAWSVNSNSLTSDGNIPKVANIADAGMRISHSEYLGQVVSTTGFGVTQYAINPGLVTTFPWLSKLASNFQQWQLHGMLVVFKSQMTDAVATFSALGSVAIACNLNPADRAPANQTELEQLKFCAVNKPSVDTVAPIECDKRSTAVNAYFIRTTTKPDTASIMDYDHGNIFVGTNGCPSAGVVLGRLYVTYDVSLLNPRMVLGASGNAAYICDAPSNLNYFGPTSVGRVKVTDTLGITFSTSSAVTFARGTYGTFLVMYQADGDSTAMQVGTVAFTNCAQSTTFKPFIGPSSVYGSFGTNTHYVYGIVLEITDPTAQATITYSVGTLPANGTKAHLNVISLGNIIPGVAPPTLSLSVPNSVAVESDSDDDEKSNALIANDLETQVLVSRRNIPSAAVSTRSVKAL